MKYCAKKKGQIHNINVMQVFCFSYLLYWPIDVSGGNHGE